MTSLSQEFKSIAKDVLEKARVRYKEVKKEDSKDRFFSDKELNDIGKKLNDKEKEIEERLCEDNYVGHFIIKGEKIDQSNLCFDFNSRKDNKDVVNTNNFLDKDETGEIIVVFLESPHIEEYKDKNFIAPALGATGNNLKRCFTALMKDELNDGTYHVILANSIQYQCSLGVSTSYFRDRIWLSMWKNLEVRENFGERLKSYKPDIIVNLCTNGNHQMDILRPQFTKTVINNEYLEPIGFEDKDIEQIVEYVGNEKITLKSFIQKEIDKYVGEKDIKLYTGTHPSSWWILNVGSIPKDE